MAKKISKKSLPKWLKSKWFLFGAALTVSALAIWGYSTFAHSRPSIPIPCLGGVIKYGSSGSCVLAAQKGINYICRETPYIREDSKYDSEAMRNRVKGFQAAVATTSDGIIGPTTWDRLYTRVNTQASHTMGCKWPR